MSKAILLLDFGTSNSVAAIDVDKNRIIIKNPYTADGSLPSKLYLHKDLQTIDLDGSHPEDIIYTFGDLKRNFIDGNSYLVHHTFWHTDYWFDDAVLPDLTESIPVQKPSLEQVTKVAMPDSLVANKKVDAKKKHFWEKFLHKQEPSVQVKDDQSIFEPKPQVRDVTYMHQFSIYDLLVIYFRQIHKLILNNYHYDILGAWITCPVYFTPEMRHNLEKAVNSAGMTVLGLLNEPKATALAYNTLPEINGRCLIVDSGAGTTDLCLIDVDVSSLRIIAQNGDNLCGGIDINYIIEDFLYNHYKEYQPGDFKWLAEKLKLALNAPLKQNESPEGRVFQYTYVNTKQPNEQQNILVSYQQYLQFAAPFFERYTALCEKFLTQTPNAVILTGGSNLNLWIQAWWKKQLPYVYADHVYDSVILGLDNYYQLCEASPNYRLKYTSPADITYNLDGLDRIICKKGTNLPFQWHEKVYLRHPSNLTFYLGWSQNFCQNNHIDPKDYQVITLFNCQDRLLTDWVDMTLNVEDDFAITLKLDYQYLTPENMTKRAIDKVTITDYLFDLENQSLIDQKNAFELDYLKHHKNASSIAKWQQILDKMNNDLNDIQSFLCTYVLPVINCPQILVDMNNNLRDIYQLASTAYSTLFVKLNSDPNKLNAKDVENDLQKLNDYLVKARHQMNLLQLSQNTAEE